MNHFFSVPEEIVIHQSDEVIHSTFKPLVQSELKGIELRNEFSIDTIYYLSSLRKRKGEGSLLRRKIFQEHLFVVDQEKLYLTLDPLFDFALGSELEGSDGEMLYKNMRGFLLRANIGEKISVQSTFRENQARYSQFITKNIMRTGDALGQGKVRDLDHGGFDFSMASAYVSYSPSSKINLQIGHGKHFIGNGIKSHFLSDRAYNYPFLRINTRWLDGKMKYSNLFASLQELKRMPYVEREGLHYRKMGNFIFLDFALSSNLYIGLFEGRVWETVDTNSGNHVLPLTSFIPVFGVNTAIEGFENNTSNGALGMNIRWDMCRLIQLYTQAAIHGSKDYSAQFGIKYYPINNLFVQLEYNQRKADLNQGQIPRIAYSHYSRSLNFNKDEQVACRINYRYKRLLGEMHLSYYGKSEKEMIYSDFNLAYLVNPATNMTFNIGLRNRRLIEEEYAKVFYMSLKTNIQDLFYDI